MKKKKIPPVHPGEILFEEFLKPMNISQNQLGRHLGVSPRRINEIVHCKRSITADTALRLAACFGNSPSFWIGLQKECCHFIYFLRHKYTRERTHVALAYQLARRRRTTTLGILGTLIYFRHFLLIYPIMPNSLGIKWKFLYY